MLCYGLLIIFGMAYETNAMVIQPEELLQRSGLLKNHFFNVVEKDSMEASNYLIIFSHIITDCSLNWPYLSRPVVKALIETLLAQWKWNCVTFSRVVSSNLIEPKTFSGFECKKISSSLRHWAKVLPSQYTMVVVHTAMDIRLRTITK